MLELLRGDYMPINKGLKKYQEEKRIERIKKQDEKIQNLHRLKYDKQTRQELIENAQYLGKIINRRYIELEKAGIEKKSYAYIRTQKETGMTRYTASKKRLEMLSSEELYDLNIDLFAKYASSTTSVSFVEKTIEDNLEKAVNTLKERLKFSSVEVSESLNVQSFREFLTLGGGRLLNEARAIGYDSTSLIEDWENARIQGVSDKEFIREWKRFRKEFDKDKFKKNVRALARRKK